MALILLQGESYNKAAVDDQKSIRTLVEHFVALNQGGTDEGKRANLPRLVKAVQPAVDYVMSKLPEGQRVDGYLIRPLLEEVVAKAISELPEPEIKEGI